MAIALDPYNKCNICLTNGYSFIETNTTTQDLAFILKGHIQKSLIIELSVIPKKFCTQCKINFDISLKFIHNAVEMYNKLTEVPEVIEAPVEDVPPPSKVRDARLTLRDKLKAVAKKKPRPPPNPPSSMLKIPNDVFHQLKQQNKKDEEEEEVVNIKVEPDLPFDIKQEEEEEDEEEAAPPVKKFKVTHPSESFLVSTFICAVCQRKFSSEEFLLKHMNTHHFEPDVQFLCDECNIPFTSQEFLNLHIFKKHSKVKVETSEGGYEEVLIKDDEEVDEVHEVIDDDDDSGEEFTIPEAYTKPDNSKKSKLGLADRIRRSSRNLNKKNYSEL